MLTRCKKVKADIALRAIWDHPTQVNAPRLTRAMEAGTRFTYPEGMEG